MNRSSRNTAKPAALFWAGAIALLVAGCGLLDGRSEPQPLPPPPRPAEPVNEPVLADNTSDEPDWLAEYRRNVEAIEANQPVTIIDETTPAFLPPTPFEGGVEPVSDESFPPPPVFEPSGFEPSVVETTSDFGPSIVEIFEPGQQPPPPVFDNTAEVVAFEPPVFEDEPVFTPPEVFTPSEAFTPPAPSAFSSGSLGQDDIDTLIAASRQHAAMLDQRTSALVERFLDEGLSAMDVGDLAQAREYFGSAVELDPSNPGARELYDQAGMLLGESAPTLGTIARSARDRASARADQQRVMVQHSISRGRAAMAADDPDTAQRHFEDAMALLRSTPDLGARSQLEQEAAGLIMQAKAQALDLARRRDDELTRRAVDLQQEYDQADAVRDQRRVDQLMRNADEAFVRDDFETAEEALNEALKIDSSNPDVRDLLELASSARHDAVERATRRLYQREWQDTFDQLENESIPQNDLMVFPEDREWSRIVDRGNKVFGGGTDEARADQDVHDRLAAVRIPVNFQGVTLDEIAANLQQVTGLNFLLSQEVRDIALDDTYDLLDRADQSVDRVLKILLEDMSVTPLSYEVRDGVVQIITQDEARGDYSLEMYDIRDLTVTPSDYPTQDFNLLPSGTDADSFRDGVDIEDPLPFIAEDALLSLIQENIAIDSWIDDPERTIQLLPGTLVVRQTPDVHSQIKSLLHDLRSTTKAMIHIEARFIEVEDSFLEDIGVDIRGLDTVQLEDFGTSGVGFGTPSDPLGIGTGSDAGAYYQGSNGDLKGRTENLFDFSLGEANGLNNTGGLSLQALFLDDTDVQAVLRAVTKYQNSNIVNAPSLTLRSGQRGNIEALVTRTYVRDFEPEIAQAAVIAQPELDNVKEGVVLDVRAVASADQRFITLELRPTVAELIPDRNGDVLPDATVSLATGNASDVVIELPELEIQRVRTTATIPDGATLLLGGLKRTVEQEQESGLPFLSDIPIVSFFFDRKGEYTSRQKLLILLKASLIVPDENEPVLGFAK